MSKRTKLATTAKHILMINDSLSYYVPSTYDYNDIELRIFNQMWPDTAGGMSTPGTIAGQAMTIQTTYVIYNSLLDLYHIFFDGQFAYKIYGHQANDNFLKDLKSENLKDKGSYKDYLKCEDDNE